MLSHTVGGLIGIAIVPNMGGIWRSLTGTGKRMLRGHRVRDYPVKDTQTLALSSSNTSLAEKILSDEKI